MVFIQINTLLTYIIKLNY